VRVGPVELFTVQRGLRERAQHWLVTPELGEDDSRFCQRSGYLPDGSLLDAVGIEIVRMRKFPYRKFPDRKFRDRKFPYR
jgi:hypothetical protein